MLLVHPHSPLPSCLWRAVALLGMGLVMLMTLSSVSPELHARLHEKATEDAPGKCAHHGASAHGDSPANAPHSNEGEEDSCAVTMFSHGVVYQAGALVAQPCEGMLRAVNHGAFERLALAQPRFLHLPPQAPPAV
jgi:hypothetical protein